MPRVAGWLWRDLADLVNNIVRGGVAFRNWPMLADSENPGVWEFHLDKRLLMEMKTPRQRDEGDDG
jgi:hypothetical protein